jgi:D-amino-acid dehydrogenase
MSTQSPNAEVTRTDPDVLVVGGGIVGLFGAYFLRRAGRTVALVERGSIGGRQSSSYGNTGFVGTHGAAPLAEPGLWSRHLFARDSPVYVKPRLDADLARWLWSLRRACDERQARAGFDVLVEVKRRSLAILADLCQTGPLAATFVANGMVLAFRTPQAFERACRGIPQAVAGGVPLRVLDSDELHALEPDVDFDIRGALYNEEGAALHAGEFLVAFGQRLAGMGVDVYPHTEVTGFDATSGTVRRVHTTRGDFAPGETVIAAGAWSAGCARLLDLDLRLQPVKGHSVTVRTPEHAPRRPVSLVEDRIAVMPLGDQIRFAGVLELTGMDTAVSPRRVAAIRRTVRAYLPQLDGAETVEEWSGLRPCTPDSIPFIGRAPRLANVSVACGHGHIGMGLAPAGGQLLAQIVTGERPEINPGPFRLDRFGRRGAIASGRHRLSARTGAGTGRGDGAVATVRDPARECP